MSESFAELLEESLSRAHMRSGAIVKARVVQIDSDFVTVNAGLKSEGMIPAREFYNESGVIGINVGDEVDVSLETIEDGYGETVLSREKARVQQQWEVLESAFATGDAVSGVITDKVKGGFTVMIGEVRAFLPGSLVDVRPIKDTTHLEGREHKFKCIKLDRKRNNVVVSRRAVVEHEYSEERRALMEGLQEGQVIKGIVKNLTDYGAFVDLGGLDGLLHITDMAWKRVRHPSEVVNVGDEIEVRILKFDKERVRVSLGLKQLGEDPWKDLARRYPVATKLYGMVTNVTDYGCFVEIEEGVEGLVHMSEMDWTNRNIQPNKLVQAGDRSEVMVLDIDEDRRRVSLGMKQCRVNPWEEFAALHKKGDRISGAIKSTTDFGIFVELNGGIDGLVHLSDVSWDLSGEEAIREFKKGDVIETMVLLVDPTRERISLGIKQMTSDPLSEYLAKHEKGSVVNGTVKSLDPQFAIIELADGIEGTLKATDISRDRAADATKVFQVGDPVEAMIVGVDGRSREIQLSIRAKDRREEADAVNEYRPTASVGMTNLGELLKEKMTGNDD